MQILGHLDVVNAQQIRGWATAKGSDAPLDVEIRINGKEYAVVRADRLRPDVAAKGLHSTGHCGFIVDIPEASALRYSDLVSARVVGADRDLPGSPMLCKAPPGQTLIPEEALVPAGSAAAQDLLPALPVFPPAPQRSSWTIFCNSFLAVFLRMVKARYGSQRFGYVWAIVEPLLYILILQGARTLLGRGRLGEQILGVDAFYFIALGIVPFFVFSRCFNGAQGSINASKGIFNYRQLKPIDAVLARLVLEVTIMIFVFGLVIFGLYWFGRPMDAEQPLEFITAAALLFLFACGAGLFADVYLTRSENVRMIMGMLDRPLFFISGVFFTMRDIPPLIEPYLIWNPILHAIDLGRGAMLTEYDSPGSWLYLFFCSIFMLLLGLSAYRRNLFRLTQQ